MSGQDVTRVLLDSMIASAYFRLMYLTLAETLTALAPHSGVILF